MTLDTSRDAPSKGRPTDPTTLRGTMPTKTVVGAGFPCPLQARILAVERRACGHFGAGPTSSDHKMEHLW